MALGNEKSHEQQICSWTYESQMQEEKSEVIANLPKTATQKRERMIATEALIFGVG
jgi:hypothetical protein